MTSLHIPSKRLMSVDSLASNADGGEDDLMKEEEEDGDTTNIPEMSSTTSINKRRLNPHRDARKLVRLLQCPQCSQPFRTPVTLPCGNSICRECLPPSHPRENISYPATPSRQIGIVCPFKSCGEDHPSEECSVDVVLLKITEAIADEFSNHRRAAAASAGRNQSSFPESLLQTSPQSLLQSPLRLDPDSDLSEQESITTAPSSQESTKPQHHKQHRHDAKTVDNLPGGRLVATYTLAQLGGLPYEDSKTDDNNSSLIDRDAFDDDSEGSEAADADVDIFAAIKFITLDKVDCQVCYCMLLDPVTTLCGHSFCRKCLARILDHSRMCPHCRRQLGLPPGLSNQPSNKAVSRLLDALYPDEIESRAENVAAEEGNIPGGLDTALFVCTVAFPSMPMILHVFEPRYRLMVRRVLEGNRQFGMIPYNEHNHPQGGLGRTQFMETGTMLQIEQCQMEPDGRSWLLCQGLYRFKVKEHDTLDGYIVGRVERHDDVILAEEERIEAEETSAEAALTGEVNGDIDYLPTSEILQQCLAFLQRAQAQSARWLQGSIQHIYGAPPTDAALLPYWFASVVPLPESEKYRLLPTTSVRERLKLTLRWARKIESQRWFTGNVCVAL